jgi:phosphoribosylglycinamide formyltransferase-1
MIKICILTSGELRHTFFRKYLASCQGIEVIKSYCEVETHSYQKNIEGNKFDYSSFKVLNSHFRNRNIFEQDFFKLFCNLKDDFSNPIQILKGEINNPKHVVDIINSEPDIIVSYGCSIIKSELLNIFKGRFVNVHLGLSPYYRGAGTNFWPFVNKELQFVGTTFMQIDSGIDSGEIIHQIRAEFNSSDNIHTVGNRLIRDSAFEMKKLIYSYDRLSRIPNDFYNDNSIYRYYRVKDFNEEVLSEANMNIGKGIIDYYIQNKDVIDYLFPIFTNPAIL